MTRMKNLLVMEQMERALPREVVTWVRDREPETHEEFAKLVDRYEENRKSGGNPNVLPRTSRTSPDKRAEPTSRSALTWEEHLLHLRTTLEKFRQEGLTLKINKCQFGKREVHCLGHVIENGQSQPDPEKIETIQAVERPYTKTERGNRNVHIITKKIGTVHLRKEEYSDSSMELLLD
ncbi:polyprotein of retroviral origin, putative [Ixodes scapularis]|uniref:Polyprotein of retroviral origin, putative n=1 Tax=Ixodes scapularis TaxID=6945 RepID=B7PH15_IXOSC|nr:polyprotein of retroviral origin, putative [Ixodes scapularis]|eukprot:XP_002401918.1 polyprotein of retroviral origin, putative [Ixodes scapularis]